MRNERRTISSSHSFCLHHHLSLSVPAADDGAGAAHCRSEDDGASTGNERYNRRPVSGRRFSASILLMGVVTGIPMEFQFGTNWSRVLAPYRRRDWSAARHGRRLFLSSSNPRFWGSFYSARSDSRRWAHWWAGVPGLSWVHGCPGYFIIVTDAWMQHPVAYTAWPKAAFEVPASGALLTNPWALIQYAHNMCGAVVTGAFVMARWARFICSAAVKLIRPDLPASWRDCGVLALVLRRYFPTGDLHGKYMARHQPVTIAAMEGLSNPRRARPSCSSASRTSSTQTNRQSDRRQQGAEFPHLRHHRGRGAGPGSFPEGSVATNIPLVYLRLSHHGWTGDYLCRS